MNKVAKNWDSFSTWYSKWKNLDSEFRELLIKIKIDPEYLYEIDNSEHLLVQEGWLSNTYYSFKIKAEADRFLKIIEKIYKWSFLEPIDAYYEFVKGFTTKDQRIFISNCVFHYNLESISAGLCTRWFSGEYLNGILQSQSAKAYYESFKNLGLELDLMSESFLGQLKAVSKIKTPILTFGQKVISTDDILKLKNFNNDKSVNEFLVENAIHGIMLPIFAEDYNIYWLLPPSKTQKESMLVEAANALPQKVFYSQAQILSDLRFYLKYLETHDVELLMSGGISAATHRKIISTCASVHPMLQEWGLNDLFRGRLCYEFLHSNKWLIEENLKRNKWVVKPSKKSIALSKMNESERRQCLNNTLSFGKTLKSDEWLHWLEGWENQQVPWKSINNTLWETIKSQIGEFKNCKNLDHWINEVCLKSNPLTKDKYKNPDSFLAWKNWRGSPEEIYGALFLKVISVLTYFGMMQIVSVEDGIGIVLTEEGLEHFNIPLNAKNKFKSLKAESCLIVNTDHTLFQTDKDLFLASLYHYFCDSYSPEKPIKISKEAVLRSLQSGFDLDELLNILKQSTQNEIPPNIISELKYLAHLRAPVQINESILVECSDAMVLSAIKDKFPKDFVHVTGEILRYIGKQKPEAIKKKLMAKGLL